MKRIINNILVILRLKPRSSPDVGPDPQSPWTFQVKRSDLLLLDKKIKSKEVEFFATPKGNICHTILKGGENSEGMYTWDCTWGYSGHIDGYRLYKEDKIYSEKEKIEQIILMYEQLDNRDLIKYEVIEDEIK